MHDNTGRCTFLLDVVDLKGEDSNTVRRRCALKHTHVKEGKPHNVELPNGQPIEVAL